MSCANVRTACEVLVRDWDLKFPTYWGCCLVYFMLTFADSNTNTCSFFFLFFPAFPFYMHIQKSELHGIFLTVSRLNICNTRLAICNVEMARVWSSVVGWNQKESEKCSCVFRSVGVVRNLWNLFFWNFLVSLCSFSNFWYSECLHWNGGAPALLEAGANCIKELSTFEVIIKQAKRITRNYWSL